MLENKNDEIAVTVLGVGNPIMGDDGVGLELLSLVEASFSDPRVEYVDGGTSGMELLPVVQSARRLLILDAVSGPVPGEVVELPGDQIPRLLAAKLSPHQLGLLDIFAAARLLGTEPDEVVVIGIVPEFVDVQVGLTPTIAASLPDATAKAISVLHLWLPMAHPHGSPVAHSMSA